MKNITWLLLILFFTGSCSKQLEELPQSIAAETFYKTNKEIEAGLNAIYVPVRSVYGGFGAFYTVQVEIYTEYFYGRGSHAPINTYVLDNTNINRTSDFWAAFYQSVRNANIVIKRIPFADQVTEADKNKYLGEAKFLRALWYFHLVRHWAGVPLRTDANIDSTNLKRSSSTDIYNLILSDLADANQYLPDNPRLVGAPSKWAAKTLLTHVMLQLGRYQEARNYAAEVIASAKYSLVPVATVDDFEKIFGPTANNTPEEIFYLKFSNTVANMGNGLLTYAHYPNSGYFPPGGFYTLYSDSITNKFVYEWPQNDLRRKMNWYSSTFGLGNTTILCKKYIDRAAQTASGAGNDHPMYRYADLLLMYAEADARVNNGVTADALEKLNMVHRRGYGLNATVPSSTVDFEISDFPTLESFLKTVVKERGYENILEGKHWLDLVRMGWAQSTIKEMKGIDVPGTFLLGQFLLMSLTITPL
ncbi:MAG: RagB/SusD family nutrient uptake outer membrane protein [Agriterribacter sp.]